eukprot:gene19250-biopygen17138
MACCVIITVSELSSLSNKSAPFLFRPPSGENGHRGGGAGKTYGLPVPLPPPPDPISSSISMQQARAELLRRAELLIIDEVSMVPIEVLNAIDRLLRDVMRCAGQEHLPFGGKIVVLGGDFRQIPPIIKHASSDVIIAQCVRNATAWQDGAIMVRQLRANQRAARDEHDRKWVQQLGDATLPLYPVGNRQAVRLPEWAVFPRGQSIHAMVNDVYAQLRRHARSVAAGPTPADARTYFAERAILTPLNADVAELNSIAATMIDTRHMIYLSVDWAVGECEEDRVNYPVEFLNAQQAGGLPPHELHIYEGCVAILVRNIRAGLCNGTRVLVKTVHKHVIEVEILTG